MRYTDDTLDRWRKAEADLQHLVSGADVASLAGSLEAMATRRTIDVSPRSLPFTALGAGLDAARREVETKQQRIGELEAGLEQSAERCATLQKEADAARELRGVADVLDRRLAETEAALLASRAEVTSLTGRLTEAEANATALGHDVNRLTREIKAWSERMANIDRRFPVRVYRLARRLAGRP